MRENEKLVTIERFECGFDAELAKVALDTAGIDAVVLGEDLGPIYPESGTSFFVLLQVFEKDVEKAKQILTEIEPLEDEDVESDQ